jgi:hypothetical protein
MNVAYGTNISSGPKRINTDDSMVYNTKVVEVGAGQSIINIHVSAKNLPKADLIGESDPMCVMSIPINGKYVEIARTEVIWNDPNPSFVSYFLANYIFETVQPLRFSFYDCDSENADLSKHDFLGYIDTDVQTLVTKLHSNIEFKFISKRSGSDKTVISLICEQVASCNDIVTLRIETRKNKKMRTFSKNNPYVLISKCSEAGRSLPVYKGETVPKCYQCVFRQFEIPLQVLCNGDLDIPIDITIVDNHVSRPDVPIGTCSMSLRSFMENLNQAINITDKKGKKVGEVIVREVQIYKKPTFIDYLRSGLHINLITAVDFTGSNGNPSQPTSLHYLSSQMNQYELCINAVGQVICPYDTDQMFPMYGFGGFFNGRTDHCFPLTFGPDPCCQGLEGMLAAYRNSLQRVQLSGPTYFAPIIKAATSVAVESFNTTRTYTILMIITDGVINDFRETTDAIVEASNGPLSIIIVGVGTADFSDMDRLDGDDVVLTSSTGQKCARDIVQFVPFSKYLKQNGVGLSSEVLAEIPDQVIKFCQSHGFVPNMS